MANTSLEGATAIVTGASRGFGRGIAGELLHGGAHVVGVARGESALRNLREVHDDPFEFEAADAADAGLAGRLFATNEPQIVVLNARASPVTGSLDEQTWQTFSANWHSDVRIEAFEDQLGPILTAEHVAKTVTEIVADDTFSDAAYLVAATDLLSL